MPDADQMREMFREIAELAAHFYTEGEPSARRLPDALLPYAGPLSIIFQHARDAIGWEEARRLQQQRDPYVQEMNQMRR